MVFASGFSWFNLVPAIDEGTAFAFLHGSVPNQVYVSAWFVCFGLIGFAVLARMGLERARARPGIERYVPDAGLTPRNMAESSSTASRTS